MTKKTAGIDEDVFAVDMEEQQKVNKEVSQKKKSRKDDPRYYRPRLVKEGKNYVGSYQSMIRLIPQLGWVQDKSLPYSVEQYMHYIQEKQHGLFLYIKCRKTLGPNEKCPVCDANWAIWRKATEAKDEAMVKVAKARIAKGTAIGNILIVADLNNPELNGEVKLWEHTIPINAKLLAPLRAGDTSNDAGEPTKKTGFKKEKKEEKLDFFMPYHPTQGRNRIVIIEPPEDNPTIVSYNESFWDEESSTIGWYDKGADPDKDEMIVPATTDEIMAVLEKAESLKQFIDDVPTLEEMTLQLSEYNEKVAEAGGSPLVDPSKGGASARPALTPRPGDSNEFYETEKKDDDIPITDENPKEEKEEKQEKPSLKKKAPVSANSAPADDADDDDEDDDLPF